MNEQYTKQQQDLLRHVRKTDKWQYRTPFLYLFYLLPIIFVGDQMWHWAKLRQFHYCIAVRVNGKVLPVDFEPLVAIACIVLLVAGILTLTSWLVVSIWQERRTFREILEIKERSEGSSQPPAAG